MYFPATLFNALSIVTAAIYFCSASLIAFNIIRNQSIENPRAWFLTSAVIAIVLHLLLVTYSISINRAIPNDLFNMLSLVFLVISVLFCFSAISQSIETLALIVFPFSAVAVLLNVGNQAMLGATNTYESALQLHILLSILSYSLLTVAAFQAIMLSIQEKQLHNRQPGPLINALPPLQLMEKLLFQSLSAGVLLLTLALGTGFVFLDDLFAQHLAHKSILSVIAWLVFSTLIWGRHYLGWRGQKAVKFTYAGYFALMLAYFGSKFVLQLVLQQS